MVNEEQVREIISEMVLLLITYAIELTTYQTMYEALSNWLVDAGSISTFAKCLSAWQALYLSKPKLRLNTQHPAGLWKK